MNSIVNRRISKAKSIIPALTLALFSCVASPVFAQSNTEPLDLPLTGSALTIATEAYDAYNKGDYETAITKAREVIRQRPDSVKIKGLLIDALSAAGKTEEASKEADAILNSKESSPAELAEKAKVQNQLARKAAEQVYRAFEKNDYDAAVKYAQEAVRLAPDQSANRHLLILAQLRAKNLTAAEETASSALDTDKDDPVALMLRSYLRLKQENRDGGVADAKSALQQDWMGDGDMNNTRLIAADYLIAAGDFTEAEKVLSQFTGDKALLKERIKRLNLAKKNSKKGASNLAEIQAPEFECRVTPYGRECSLIPGAKPADAGYESAAKALAAYQAKDYATALAKIKQATELSPNNADYKKILSTILLAQQSNSLRSSTIPGRSGRLIGRSQAAAAPAPDQGYEKVKQISALLDAKQQQKAQTTYEHALTSGTFKSVRPIDLAYLATRIGDKYTANEQFTLAQTKGQLEGTSLIDAAYAARRIYDNDRAIELLKAAIDSVGPTMEPQQLFALRREVADLSRTWGATLSINHNSVGVFPGSPQQSSDANSTQFGSEIYWRPKGIGYRDGALFELFARNFTTMHDSNGGQTGWNTSQGSFGARWKPLKDYNLVLEAARLVPFGKYGTNDTMLRVAYSDGRGTDLRVDVPSWWMWTIYGEGVRYLEAKQNIASFEGRFGRSYRVDEISDRLVVTPFLALGGNYNNLLDPKWAIGTGPGINFRWWFREDKYTAPMSYVDLTAQYRVKLAGDDRAKGLFASLTLSY